MEAAIIALSLHQTLLRSLPYSKNSLLGYCPYEKMAGKLCLISQHTQRPSSKVYQRLGPRLSLKPWLGHFAHPSRIFTGGGGEVQKGQDFDKNFVFEGVRSKEVDRRISWEKLDKVWC